jgi:hypothetical protein
MPFGFAVAGGALLGATLGGGGGGGGSGSTGAQQTGSTVYNTNIPQYAQPYVQNMLNATQSQLFQTDANGNITGFNQYQPYTGMDQQALQNAQQAVAGFSPLQQQAQSSAANLQMPGQYGQATNLTNAGIMGALGTTGQAGMYGRQGAQAGQQAAGQSSMYGMGSVAQGQQGANIGQQLGQQSTNPSAVGAYMNPYIQNSLNPQLQLLAQQTGINSAAQQSAATSAGAFGGSRSALANSLNQQAGNLAAQQAIGQGYNTAYTNAQQQMNAANQAALAGNQQALTGYSQGLQGAQQAGNLGIAGAQAGLAGVGAQQAAYNQAMQGAGQLGQLGTTQLAAQQGILGTQNQLGAQQQANAQQIINQGIQNYATAQQYPLMQLGTMSNMLRGLPMQSATTQQYQAAPSALTQTIGAAGTGAMLGSMYAAKGGLLKTKKMAAGGIASYGEGDIIESTKQDLEQMPSSELNKELASTSSDTVKNKIRGILAARAGVPMTAAGGGIIAFADSTDENNQSVVKEDPAAVRQAYIDAANLQAAQNPPSDTPVAPTNTSRFSQMGTPTSRFSPQGITAAAPTDPNAPVLAGRGVPVQPTISPRMQAALADQARTQQVQTPPAASGALGLTPGESVVQPDSAATTAASGAITNAAPANAAPPNPKIVHAEQAKADAKNTPHITTEQYARDRALANPDNAAKVFGLPMLKSFTNENYLAEKEAYVGKNDVAGQVAKQEDVRAREEKTASDREKLIWAQAFATMGTTPGSLLVAGMTGVKSAIPQLIASKDKRNEAMNRIDDAIAAIHKADRAERAGDFEANEKHTEKGIEHYLNAYKIYNEHVDKQAQISAEYAKVGATKEQTNYLAGAKYAETVDAMNEKIRTSKPYIQAQSDLSTWANNKSDIGKSKVATAQATLAEANARIKANSERAEQVMSNVTPEKYRVKSNDQSKVIKLD